MTETTVSLSAQNRAWRTLLQGLAFDVAATISLILFTTISSAQAWGDFEWTLIAFTIFKSVAVSILSYLMRTILRDKLPPVEDGLEPPAPLVQISTDAMTIEPANWPDIDEN